MKIQRPSRPRIDFAPQSGNGQSDPRASVIPTLVLTDDARYEAILARDPRFDGVFFVGVQTTGIYCRPICPARTPGRARCAFFATAGAGRAGRVPRVLSLPARARARGRTRSRRSTRSTRSSPRATQRIAEGALNDAIDR